MGLSPEHQQQQHRQQGIGALPDRKCRADRECGQQQCDAHPDAGS
jgi:hypothetical protein